MDNIKAEFFEVGMNTVIEPSAIIRGLNGNASRVVIGDNCYIGAHVQIICDDFSLGDYCRIQHNTTVHGYLPCKIGHNAWIGQFVIIDSIGGMTIGNNCCIGAQSQLWSHFKFGDTLEGCRFLSEKSMTIGNDVWIAGHCSLTPIIAADKSMAMAGSVVTKNMEYNQVYAGTPAMNITNKVGTQFNEVSVEEKLEKMKNYLAEFGLCKNEIEIVGNLEQVDFENRSKTFFEVSGRKYTKRNLPAEIAFMKFLLPEKAKFVPF